MRAHAVIARRKMTPLSARRCTAKTSRPRSSSSRHRTWRATSALPSPPSSSRPPSSRRSRSSRCRRRSCARGSCSSRSPCRKWLALTISTQANLFFDSESRAVQASATAEDDAQQASSLATQAKMMQIINRLQTTNAVQQPGGAPGSSAAPAHVPPPMPPQLFAAPERQQIVPGVKPPEARSDLVDLMRVVNDHSESYAPQTNTRLHTTPMLILTLVLGSCGRDGGEQSAFEFLIPPQVSAYSSPSFDRCPRA